MGKKNAVWITGASSGIGKSLSIKFAENNFNVIASARRIEPIQQTITANNFTSEFIPLQNDVSNYADLSKKINELKRNTILAA
ncbi:MAG: SDR family NAD(P)-dependent oxidoreductase [Ignavibacteriales bacterium]|nr:SDR family NAD(P)-dependent oxidoreductase [Ignavibacteriales bacterium]